MSYSVAARQPVIRAMTVDGRQVTVSKIQLTAQGPNGSTECYSVDVAGSGDQPATAYGFNSLDDAEKFVSSLDEDEYEGHDRNGNKTTVKRQGLGVPDGMIQHAKDAPKKVKGSSALPYRVTPSEAPSDAMKPPEGQQEQTANKQPGSGKTE